MSRNAVSESYPEPPEGFSLLREYDPDTGLNYFRVKFTMSLEQAITDEMLGMLTISNEEVWAATVRELESSIRRRFG